MKISRDFINTKEIVDYGLEKRFFSFPVENLLQLDDITPHGPIVPNEPQIGIINALNHPDIRFVTACVSRRVGKSFIAYTLGFLKALEPNSKVLIVCPNYSLTKIGWSQINDLIRNFGIETLRKNAKDNEIELSNGTLIKMASASQADSAVGRSYDLIIFDEAAISPVGGDAFSIQLRPTLDKPNSKALFISTPRGNNWFYDFYMRGYSEEVSQSAWCSIHGTYRDNPRATESDIEEARQNNTSAFFRQEYEADFATFEGQIYEEFTIEKNTFDDLELYNRLMDNEEYESILGIDVGFRDPTAMVAIKYDEDTDTYYIMEEYEEASTVTSVHAAVIREFEERYDPYYIFVDSAAAQFRADLAVDYDISSAAARKSVADGLGHIATLVASGRIKVWHQCSGVIGMFLNYRWDPKPNLIKETPLHDAFSHLADAVRYGIYSHNG
jgi:hypothetical protein